MLDGLAINKAISTDLIFDIFLKEEDLKQKAAEIFTELWSDKLNQVKHVEKHFQTRLIALNKVFPKTPLPNEFRPIAIESIIVKLMELRFLPKLHSYLLNDMIPSQIGFVPGQGIFVNLVRAIKRIKLRTNQNKHCYGLFIDLKSAYNTVTHRKLFETLEDILDQEEIEFIKAMWSRIVIRMGDSRLKPNVGVAQGSLIPLLSLIFASKKF